MASVTAKNGSFTLTAYRGDAKTLLAFNLDKASAKDLAGFTIECQPKGKDPYYIFNQLRFEHAADHAQNPKEPPTSSINAPIHKFRWLHVPGVVHQGLQPSMGPYTYMVTPRYFVNGSLQPIDPKRSASVTITVDKFEKGGLQLGFTRGFTQSQAFVRHFGLKAKIKPKDEGLLFDTSVESGVNAEGERFTFEQQYEWLGFTARQRIFDMLNEVKSKKSLRLDMFAYDLNEPDLCELVIGLGKQKRARVILDNATLHHDKDGSKPEDAFEKLFAKAAGKKAIKRGKFGRFAHNKVFVVSDKNGPVKVLTGSTNFSVTGLYVNSNHVLTFNDPKVAAAYGGAFEEAWNDEIKAPAFAKSAIANKTFSFSSKLTPSTDITFSPHNAAKATENLQGLVDRVTAEGKQSKRVGSVLFAVMQLKGAKEGNIVYDALSDLHKQQNIFSYGISDTPAGIELYPIGKKTGVLVTGKPVGTILPEPFSQVPSVGLGHQVHHKFVVCGFNGDDPVVYCGSSNLAVLGEQVNGDNLIAIRDADVATVFAIEAIALVDHFDFLDRQSKGPAAKKTKKPPASKSDAAAAAKWFLGTDDRWTQKFFDLKDLHSVDRQLFA